MTTKAQLDNSGWFVQASWVITGEDASYKGASPINNVDPRNGRWGAFEVTARGSQLLVDEDAFDLGFASRTECHRAAAVCARVVRTAVARGRKNGMATHTTTIDRIRGALAASDAAPLEWLSIAAAYLPPTLATAAGCHLALSAVARLLGAIYAHPLPPH